VRKNALAIKQKAYYKVDLQKKEVEQEKRILFLEAELERTAEKAVETEKHII